MSSHHGIEAAVLSDIMITIFRVNARLLENGDHLVAPLQLTSARWQILGAVALAGKPLTTPQIAEAMGITRQGVQKQLNRMLDEGLFDIHQNPRHARSPLYALTEEGRQAFDKAKALQATWVNALAEGLELPELESAVRLLNTLYTRLNEPLPKQGA